jgi:hypothetical protein
MKKIPINYLTLKFDSEKLERQYKKTAVLQSLKIIRIGILLACLLVLIFGILDIWMVPHKLWTVWEIRIGLILVLLVVHFLSFRLFFKYHVQTLMSILTVILGTGIIGMVLISDTEGGYFYYAGLMLVIQFAHGLIRLRFINATIATIFIALTYFLIAWGIKNTPTDLIINNSFFLFSTVIIGMFISYSLEFYMRWNFWQRKMLSHQEKLLKLEYHRKTRELENVRQLQRAILPQTMPEHPAIDTAVSFDTAVEVGGDYYDFKVDSNGRLKFAMGDATGHGAQAGALVTASKILFSGWSKNEDIETFVNRASKCIKRMGLTKLFMVMVAGRFNGKGLELAGGGLPPALIYRTGTRNLEELSLRGFPLGIIAEYSYKKTNIELNEGDLLLFMTDGLPELFNSAGEMFGLERIKEAFCEVVNETPSVIINHLNKIVENWRNGFPLNDDITFIVFKVKNEPIQYNS